MGVGGKKKGGEGGSRQASPRLGSSSVGVVRWVGSWTSGHGVCASPRGVFCSVLKTLGCVDN